MKRTLIWFRNDLRIHDNEMLVKGFQAPEVIPLYCFDPRHFEKTSYGFPKTGSYRANFLLETLQDLKSNLRKLGSDLVIRIGNPEDVIPELVQEFDINIVFASKEITQEEVQVEKALEERLGMKFNFSWQSTLYHINDIPFAKEDIPDVYTQYRKKTEKATPIRKEYDIPVEAKLPDHIEVGHIPALEDLDVPEKKIDNHAVLSFKGGETEALRRLKNYIWEGDHLNNYKSTRNGLLGADYSTKFSPWLANGSLSPRRVYNEVRKYEQEREENKSTYWLIFELIWRDYFRFSAWKFGNKIFWKSGIQDKNREWSYDESKFNKWAEGTTGIPFIDANMRELNATGYMSNRGRQNVASFLSQNLNIDWRMGAEYFESLLLDYDPCSNYGNWAYNATVGHDPRNRYFNIVIQAKKYDSDGDYVHTWVPELKSVPDEFIHEPHIMNTEQQTLFDVELGNKYPKPMINLDDSYEEIKARD